MADTEQEVVPTATGEQEAGTFQPEESPDHVDPKYKEEKTEEEDKGLVEEIMAAMDRHSPPKDAEDLVEKEEPTLELPADEVEVETEIKEPEEPAVVPVIEEKKKDVLIVPHLLTDEEIRSKGVPDTEIEGYRWFHLRQAYNPNKWYHLLQEHTFHSDFITLSSAEIDVLWASCHGPSDDPPELSQEQNNILEQLKLKIDASITKFGDTGVLIKLNTRGIEDVLLERNDFDFVQDIQDAIKTELEIEQQFSNAYLIWRSWRSSSFRDSETSGTRGTNVLRRSLRRIQRSFSRSHVQSESRAGANRNKSSNEDPLAEDTANKEEEEAKTDDSPPEEAPPAEEGPAPISVEVTVEDNKGEETEPQTSTETEPQTTTDTELPATTEPAIETEPQASTETEPQAITEPATEPQTTAETEPQAIAETEPQDASKEEPEIQEIQKDDDIKWKPRSLLKKSNQSEEHQILRVKQETQQNKILRAFMRTTYSRFRVSTASEVLTLLCTSSRIKEELQQVKKYINVEGTEAVITLTSWSGVEVARYPGMRFRGFVYQNNLTGLSQVDDILYIPNVSRFNQTIQKKIECFFNNYLKEALQAQQDSYIVDLFVAPNKIYVLELYPFHTSTGACLYTWQQCQKQLMNGPFEFRHVHTPFKRCFSGLLPHWQQVCETIAQERRSEERHHNKCTLL